MISRRARLRLTVAFIFFMVALGLASYNYIVMYIHPPQPPVPGDTLVIDEAQTYLPTGPLDETLEIRKGDTFTTLLDRNGVSTDQIHDVITALKKVFNPRDLRPDHEIFITYTHPDQDILQKDLIKIVIKVAIGLEVQVDRNEFGIFEARRNQKELIHELKATAGVIQDSLYLNASKEGVPAKILHQMINAFLYDVDFQRSFQSGDQYGLLYDTDTEPDTLQEKPGDLLFAELNLSGKIYRIYRFKSKSGVMQYYNDKGDSIKKGLLRTPIDGARISSGFGGRRHPILGYTKVHKGVDFAAPTGTPIMASGDGYIEKIGPFSSYGNYIRIRHSSTYSTAYAHLSRFSKGLRARSAVRQGQIIGYVGTTGRSTGPHLHYEVIKNGIQINPKNITALPTGKLEGKDYANFMTTKATIDAQYQRLRHSASPAQLHRDSQKLSEKITETDFDKRALSLDTD